MAQICRRIVLTSAFDVAPQVFDGDVEKDVENDDNDADDQYEKHARTEASLQMPRRSASGSAFHAVI